MRSLKEHLSPAEPSNPYLRVTLYTALSLLCKGAQILSRLPAAETALPAGDLERFRLLSAADSALGWLVGQGAGDSVDSLGRESALGDAAEVLDWSEEEAGRQFGAALADLQEGG
jgi:hypothetical protein